MIRSGSGFGRYEVYSLPDIVSSVIDAGLERPLLDVLGDGPHDVGDLRPPAVGYRDVQEVPVVARGLRPPPRGGCSGGTPGAGRTSRSP